MSLIRRILPLWDILHIRIVVIFFSLALPVAALVAVAIGKATFGAFFKSLIVSVIWFVGGLIGM